MKNFKIKPNRTLKNFRMYKDGKKWVFASTVVMLLGIGGASLDVHVPDSMQWLTTQQVLADDITGYDPNIQTPEATQKVDDILQNIVGNPSDGNLQVIASGIGYELVADNLVNGKLSPLSTVVEWVAKDGGKSYDGKTVYTLVVTTNPGDPTDGSAIVFLMGSYPGKPARPLNDAWKDQLNPAVTGEPYIVTGKKLDTLLDAAGKQAVIYAGSAVKQDNPDGSSAWTNPTSQDLDPNAVPFDMAGNDEILAKAKQMAEDADAYAGSTMPTVTSAGQDIADQATALFTKINNLNDPSIPGIKDELNQLMDDLNGSVAFANAANEKVQTLTPDVESAVSSQDVKTAVDLAKKDQKAASLLDEASAEIAGYTQRLQQITTEISTINTNVGSDNSGDNNTGDSNTGNDNSGDNNTGNSNVGSDNSGDNNTGNSNVGSDNSGDNNTGDNNTGNSNVGSDNSGDNNTGNSNTGSDNSGDNNNETHANKM